jgi:hypothetical protein
MDGGEKVGGWKFTTLTWEVGVAVEEAGRGIEAGRQMGGFCRRH